MTARPSLFALAALALLGLVAAPAAAHKTQIEGDVKIVWGFLNEPAVTMTKNGLDLHIRDNATGYAIPGLESNLTAELRYGDLKLPLKLAGQHGKPGLYTATVTPSQPGLYTLYIKGSINGTSIDLAIPGAHEIEAIEETYFPAIEAEAGASEERLAALETELASLKAQVSALDAKLATQAQTPAPTSEQRNDSPGAGAALVAIAVAGVAVALRRRS